MRTSYAKQLYNLYTSDERNNNFETYSIAYTKKYQHGSVLYYKQNLTYNIFLITTCFKNSTCL